MPNDFKYLIHDIQTVIRNIDDEIEGTIGNKAAARRVRKCLLDLEKLGKNYRKTSVAFHRK